MASEKVDEAQIHEGHLSDSKIENEKSPEIREHEPYDATALNVAAGEFPLHPTPRGEHDQNSLKDELIEEEVLDLYKPFPIDPAIPKEDHILTIRAVVTGMILGSLVNASNLYLGRLLSLINRLDP